MRLSSKHLLNKKYIKYIIDMINFLKRYSKKSVDYSMKFLKQKNKNVLQRPFLHKTKRCSYNQGSESHIEEKGNLVTNSRACKCLGILIREDYPPRIWHMSVRWASSYPSPPSRKFQRSKQTTNVHGRDKDAEISREKAATTALNALQQLSWPH